MRRWPLSHRLRVADSLCSSGRRSGSGRGPLVVSFGGVRFLEPLAPSKQQQHGSQRLNTRPQSAGCTFPRTLRGRNGEFSGSCTDTLEALIVAYDSFNYHSQPGPWGATPWTSTASGSPCRRPSTSRASSALARFRNRYPSSSRAAASGQVRCHEGQGVPLHRH